MTSVIVVGAGIGGLTAAIALDRAGVEVTVVDPAPHPDELARGFGIHLWSNALQAFDHIGLKDVVAAVGNQIEIHRYLRLNGHVMGTFEAGAASADHGAPTVGLARPALHRVLVEALGVDRLRLGSAVTAVDHNEGSASVTLGDGTRLTADAVVGADGIDSTVRRSVLDTRIPRYSGMTSWRGLCNFTDPALDKEAVQVYWGRGARMVMYQVSGGLLYWLALVNAPPHGVDPPGGARAAAAAHLDGWPGFILEAIQATDEQEVHRTDISRLAASRQWGRGRVTTLGDAVHAMTPDVAQGACQAIEDGVALGIAFGNHPDVRTALRRYEQVRRPRAMGMARMSTMVNRVAGMESAAAIATRNHAMLPAFFRWQSATEARSFLTPVLDR